MLSDWSKHGNAYDKCVYNKMAWCCNCKKHSSGHQDQVNTCDAEDESTNPAFKCSGNLSSEFTEVEIDENLKEADGTWTVAGVFKSIFHASTDSKLALKLYGSKKGVLIEQKRQDTECCSRWMIHPCSHFRWYWDLIVVGLLLFTVTVLPISIAFYSDDQLQPGWLSINIIVDTLFLTDVFINFRTGIFSSDSVGDVILAPKIVAKKYLKGWFVVDITSSFPFDYFTLIATRGEVNSSLLKASRALRVIRLAKLLSLLRLLRISRLLRFMQRWEDLFDLAGGVMRILKLIMLMLLLAHWNGCIQFLIPVMQDVPHNSWISINRLENATVGEQYSWSLFKAISHMLCIGFGRWPPQNITEAWLTIISMMVGATFYALFIGNMSTLLLSIDTSGRLYNEKLGQVEEYMRYRKLPQNIRQRVQEFYEYRYRKKFFNEEAILKELSLGLREDIVSFNCRELVQSVPFFQNSSPNFVTAVLTKLKFEVVLKGEYIIRAGTIGDRMYFIQSGIVDVLTDDGEVATSLSDGSHFGEICLLTDDRRVATIRAATICDLFSLSKKNFQSILEEYPEMRCALETVALRRLSRLGKPTSDEMKQRGRLSTTVPPPHISKETSHSKEDVGKGKERVSNQQPGTNHSKPKKRVSAVDPPKMKDLDVSLEDPSGITLPPITSPHPPSRELQRLQEEFQSDVSPEGPSGIIRPILPPILPPAGCQPQGGHTNDPHLIEYSDSSSEVFETTM